MESLLQDLRYGARQLWRSPAFTVAAVITLGLGIGANTALFSLWTAIMTKPMPAISDTQRLIWLLGVPPRQSPRPISLLSYERYRDELRSLADFAAANESRFGIGGGAAEPEEVAGQFVSGNFFSVLGARLTHGRGFLPNEDSLG